MADCSIKNIIIIPPPDGDIEVAVISKTDCFVSYTITLEGNPTKVIEPHGNTSGKHYPIGTRDELIGGKKKLHVAPAGVGKDNDDSYEVYVAFYRAGDKKSFAKTQSCAGDFANSKAAEMEFHCRFQ